MISGSNQGRGKPARLITLAETLIIPDIIKIELNYYFIIHCFMENIKKLFCELQIDLFVLLKMQGQTHQAAA